jgi:hypothetical protein
VWLCGFVVSGYASVVSLRLTSRTVDIWPVAIRAAIVLLHHQCWPPNTGLVRTGARNQLARDREAGGETLQ